MAPLRVDSEVMQFTYFENRAVQHGHGKIDIVYTLCNSSLSSGEKRNPTLLYVAPGLAFTGCQFRVYHERDDIRWFAQAIVRNISRQFALGELADKSLF